MSATYTFDVFSSLDGFGSPRAGSDRGGYRGRRGPELLERRLALYGEEQRMVFGANTDRLLARFLATSTENPLVLDPWVKRMTSLPATVVSTSLEGPLALPGATVVRGSESASAHRRRSGARRSAGTLIVLGTPAFRPTPSGQPARGALPVVPSRSRTLPNDSAVHFRTRRKPCLRSRAPLAPAVRTGGTTSSWFRSS